MVRLRISGDTLLQALQYGVTAYPYKGWFPQVGNIRYSFNPIASNSSETGFDTSLVNARIIAGDTLSGVSGDTDNITLIVNSYVANGYDG